MMVEQVNFFKDFIQMSPSILESNLVIIEKLANKQGVDAKPGDRKIFHQYWQPFAYACIIGILERKKRPVEAQSGDKVNSDKFKYITMERNGQDILNAILIAIVGTSEEGHLLFSSPLRMNKEVSAYANYGFEVLDEQLKSGDLSNVQDMIDQILLR